MSGAQTVKITFNVPQHFAEKIQKDADGNMVDRGVWVRAVLWEWYLAKGENFVSIGQLSDTMKKSEEKSSE